MVAQIQIEVQPGPESAAVLGFAGAAEGNSLSESMGLGHSSPVLVVAEGTAAEDDTVEVSIAVESDGTAGEQ